MSTYLILGFLLVGALLFHFWSKTPSGKKWLDGDDK
jgi:hypothetical protein